MSFRPVFIAVVLGTALLLGAFMLNAYRPRLVTEQPSAAAVRASGKCAECHANLQYSIVHEYELSAHARNQVNCLQCHQPADGQPGHAHHRQGDPGHDQPGHRAQRDQAGKRGRRLGHTKTPTRLGRNLARE